MEFNGFSFQSLVKYVTENQLYLICDDEFPYRTFLLRGFRIKCKNLGNIECFEIIDHNNKILKLTPSKVLIIGDNQAFLKDKEEFESLLELLK